MTEAYYIFPKPGNGKDHLQKTVEAFERAYYNPQVIGFGYPPIFISKEDEDKKVVENGQEKLKLPVQTVIDILNGKNTEKSPIENLVKIVEGSDDEIQVKYDQHFAVYTENGEFEEPTDPLPHKRNPESVDIHEMVANPIEWIKKFFNKRPTCFKLRLIETSTHLKAEGLDGLTCKITKPLPYDSQEISYLQNALDPSYTLTDNDKKFLKGKGYLNTDDTVITNLLNKIGSQLYDSLIFNDVHEAFKNILSISAKSQNPVALQLHFESDANLVAAYPWELLHDNQRWLLAQVNLTRHINYDRKILKTPPHQVKLPLRVLYIRSRPTDLAAINGEEQDKVIERLDQLEEQGFIEVVTLHKPTWNYLLDYLTKHNDIHILHFDGHGKFDKVGLLAFEQKDNNKVNWVQATSLGTLLFQHNIQLAVLSACWSSYGGNDGVAPSLIINGVPAVVAMQLPIQVNEAAIFMDYFYKSLAKGSSVLKAVHAGRLALLGGNQFFIPTLYLNNDDDEGIIFNLTNLKE